MAGSKKAALGIIFLTVFIDLLGFGIVMPLIARYAKGFLADHSESDQKMLLGLLMACFSAMQFVFAPIWGRISDRIGRRPVLLVGLLSSTLFYAMFGYATSLGGKAVLMGFSTLTWLFIARIGAGIAGATIPTAAAYIADITGREERTKGMAIIGAAFGMGFTFGPLIGAMFVSPDVDGPPSPGAGYVAAGLSAAAFLWALFKLPESLKPGESETAGEFHLKGIGRILADPGTALVLLAIFITTFAFGQFETTLALLTKALKSSDRDNFYMFAYVGFVLTLCQGFIVRRLSAKASPRGMAILGTLIMVGGLVLIGMAAGQLSIPLLYAYIPVAIIGYALVTPALQAILSLRTSPETQGEVLGMGQSVSALARIAGPLASMQLFGDTTVARPYFAGAALMAIGFIVVTLISVPAKLNETSDAVAEPPAS